MEKEIIPEKEHEKVRFSAEIIILIFIILIVAQVNGVNDGTGVDTILESVGIEKPEQWESWRKSQKYDYLQGMGIYPESGGKYQGRADISGFFDWLGVEQPENWNELSFEEKNNFVNSIIGDKKLNNKKTLIDNTEAEPGEEIKNNKSQPALIRLLFMLQILFIIFAGFFKNESIVKKIAGIISFYALPATLIFIGILAPDKHLFLEMGKWAERLLIFLLLVKPLSIIFSSKTLSEMVAFRKELGIASFWLLFVHAVGLFFIDKITVSELFFESYLAWGTAAGIAMIILGITSHNTITELLKQNWKKVQYLAYFALFGALLHTSLVSNNIMKFYVVFGLFLILKILEWNKVIIIKPRLKR